jgi:hypothetical protein
LNPFLAPLKLCEGEAGLSGIKHYLPPVTPAVIEIQAFQA